MSDTGMKKKGGKFIVIALVGFLLFLTLFTFKWFVIGTPDANTRLNIEIQNSSNKNEVLVQKRNLLECENHCKEELKSRSGLEDISKALDDTTFLNCQKRCLELYGKK